MSEGKREGEKEREDRGEGGGAELVSEARLQPACMGPSQSVAGRGRCITFTPANAAKLRRRESRTFSAPSPLSLVDEIREGADS